VIVARMIQEKIEELWSKQNECSEVKETKEVPMGSFEPIRIKRCDLKEKLLSFRGSMCTHTENYSYNSEMSSYE